MKKELSEINYKNTFLAFLKFREEKVSYFNNSRHVAIIKIGIK